MISIAGYRRGAVRQQQAAIARPGSIVLSYLITGTLVLLVMRMLGEMAVALPRCARSRVRARRTWPWAGFVAGWLYCNFWMIVCRWRRSPGQHPARLAGLPSWLLGLLLMGIMTAVNLMSARSYGEFDSGSPP